MTENEFHEMIGMDAEAKASGDLRVCRVCKEALPLTSDWFHKDSYDPEGWQKACKDCRRQEQQREEDKRIKALVRRLDDEIVSIAYKSAGRKGDGAKIPHAAVLYEELIRAFGGPAAFAQHFAANFAAADPGSAIREKMLRQMIQLGAKITEMGKAEMDVSKMTDEEIDKEIRSVALRLYEEGKDGQQEAV